VKDQLPVKGRTAVKYSKYMYPNTASCGYEPTIGLSLLFSNNFQIIGSMGNKNNSGNKQKFTESAKE